MPLEEFKKQIDNFTLKIKKALDLQEDENMLIHHKRIVVHWIQQQNISLRERKEEERKNQGLFTGILNLAGMNDAVNKIQNEENTLQKVKSIMKGSIIDFQLHEVEELQIPKEVKESLKRLNKQKIPTYYGVVICPLLEGLYLKTRESFDSCIKTVYLSELKFMHLGSDTSDLIRHQRNLLEQLFNKLYTKESELSMVIKIEVEKDNFQKSKDIFCLVEDVPIQKTAIYKDLSCIQSDQNEDLYLSHDGDRMYVDQMSVFNCLLSQMLTVPFQTIVSDYALSIEQNKAARIIKTQRMLSNGSLSNYIKEHPSLRNPLFFFSSYIKAHQFSIQKIKAILQYKQFYGNFYEILNLLIEYVRKDFAIKTQNGTINSLFVTGQLFEVIWKIFHEVVILANWIEEMISPIKNTVTLYQIQSKIIPIFNEILKLQKTSFGEYQRVLLNFPIQNHLSMNVSKVTIERYKDRFVNINLTDSNSIQGNAFSAIFQKTVKDYNISNISIYQAIYFLNFIAKNHSSIFQEAYMGVHPSWRSKRVWKEVASIINTQFQRLSYISVNLQILALFFDFDLIKHSSHPFQAIQNDTESAELFAKIQLLVKMMKQKYQNKYNGYLSILLEKSFKHGKFKVVELLIKKGIYFNNYEDIFISNPKLDAKLNQQKEKSIAFIKNREPEMFRRYQWEKLINLKLRQKTQNSIELGTVRRGTMHVDEAIYSQLTSKNLMNNSLSRKDYLFSNNRHIGKINVQESQVYAQITEYPLLRYFYHFFLSKLNKLSLVPNFCGIFTKNGNLVHLIQSLPKCTNYKKALVTDCQSDLARRINPAHLSEAFLISMILMPTNIFLKNIFVPQVNRQEKDPQLSHNLFIVDLHDFYQKNGFQYNVGSAILKVKNSLFTFDEMRSEVSSKIMKKYLNLNILEIVSSVFKDSSALINEVNSQRPRNTSMPQEQKQLFTIIFQDSFCQSLVQRMYKIKRSFDKCLKTKAKITHLQLLQAINPALSYYYKQIIESSARLVDRQRIMMDDNFKKSFIINGPLTNFFSNSYNTEEAKDAFPNHYRKFVFQGPAENLASLYQNIQKFDVFTKKISEFKDYSHDVIQYFIRNIDLSLYSREEGEQIISKIQDYSRQYLKKEKKCPPLSVVRFNNIDEIKEKQVNFSGERLKQLIFEETSCSEGQLNCLIRRYQTMRTLMIHHVRRMQKIGDSFIAVSDTYDLKNLKYLSIVNCRDLLNVDLKCEQLQQITFRRNAALTQIFIFSRKLKNMDCYQCPKLRLENIGIYILKRVSILLSQNSCEGQMSKLEDSNYSIFLTRILRYLFNCFSESNTYKLQLIMTLIKLQLIDQKLLGFKHNQIYSKNLVHIIAKLGTEILDLVLSQIFDIFLRNELVDVLNLDQLLRIDISLLVIIEDYFVKLIKMNEEEAGAFRRTFSSLIFKECNRNNEKYPQMLGFIRTLINLIDIDAVVNFHLAISRDASIADYSELIGLLNKKKGLERLQLKIQDSIITNQFLQYLFTLDGPRNRICRIQFINCQLKVNNELLIAVLPFIKSLIFTSCRISSLDFTQNFTHLSTLHLNACKFQTEIYEVYKAIYRLKSIQSLALVGLKSSLKNNQLYLSRLFECLVKLPKLQLLDFSGNEMSKEELCFFSEQIHKVKIYQLTLYNFHEDCLNDYIELFLYHETVKIIEIEFKIRNIRLFESFVNCLSANNSIVEVSLHTDQSIESAHFLKLTQNSKIEVVHSNHPLPNWLRNHLSSNSVNKSLSSILEEDLYEPDKSSRQKNEDYCRIGLSLDGGGTRGLLIATSLDYIARKVGRPLHKIFDYIGGTSIGGVLALASTGTHDGCTPICSTQDLMQIFEIYGDVIFKKTHFGNIVSLFDTKYDIKGYEDMLEGYFKEVKLSDVLKETNVVVNAVNRYTNEDVIFRSIHSIFDRNQDFYMKDIARATSAAPIYFPSAEIKNVSANQSYSLLDGGVGLNNPSKLVIDDIIKITQNEAHKKNYFLLSLGTGRLRNQAVPTNAGIKDIAPIIDSLTESANYFIEKDLSQNCRGHYLRVSPDITLSRKESELDNTSPQTYSAYRQFALDAAEENYSNTIVFGKFKNQSFIEWLQENTDKKHQMR